MLSIERWGGFARIKLQRALINDRGVLASSSTAVIVRGAGALTNLLAMPIALHILGTSRFGTFLVLFGLINWISLGTFGVQSALGKSIASGQTTDDDISNLLGAALIYALFGSILFALVISIGAISWLKITGADLVTSAEALRAAALMMALVVVQVVLQVFEGVQIGRLTSYVTNLAKLAGSLFTFLVLIIAPHFWRSMSVFVVAISGGLVLGSALNAALVISGHPPRFSHLRAALKRIQHLAGSGVAFVVISLASLAETQGLVLLLAASVGAARVVEFGLYVRLLLIYFSVIAIVTAPLWPALISARGAGDVAWAKRTIIRTGALVFLAGITAALAIGFFGERIISLWTRTSFHGDPLLQWAMGVFFLQFTWSHFWSVLLLGLQDERIVSCVYVVEILTILVAYFTFGFGANHLISICVFSFLFISNLALPLRFIFLTAFMGSPWKRA